MATTTIEMTRTSIRILLAEGSGRSLRIRKFVAEPLAAGQEVGPQLAQAIQQVRPDRGPVIMTIPREQVITRVLKFPTTRAEELAQMVELSGKAQLPYPRDQAVADFRVIEQQGGMSTIQLVACHRELIDQQVRLVRDAGLEPSYIVPSSWGLFGWYQQIGKAPGIKEPAMVINIDHDHTELALIYQDRLMFSRSLGQGLGDWQSGPDALAPLAQEIERSLSSLRKELPGTEASSVVVTGIGPLDQWRGILEQRLGKPAVVRQMQVPELAAVTDASPVVAVGLAMADSSSLLNLLPTEARRAQSDRRQLQQFTVTGILLVVSMLLAVVLLSTYARRQERITGETVVALKKLESATQQTELQEQAVTVIEQVLRSRKDLAEMLVELFRLTPQEVLLESLTFERPRQELVVRGTAPTMRHVLDYLRSFEESGRYERVELRYSSRRTNRETSRQEFELVAHLPSSG